MRNPSRSVSTTKRTPGVPASPCSRSLRLWSDGAGEIGSGADVTGEAAAGEGAVAGEDTASGYDGATGVGAVADGAAFVDCFAPLELPARRLSIFRTSSSTPNGLNMTASDRTSAARAWTVPLSIPEMSRTGVAPSAG